MNSAAPAGDLAAAGRGRPRRILEGTLAVAVWMALGEFFHLSANAYLLLGIPITVLFQVGVRRVPLRSMWVRGAPAVRLDATTGVLAVVLALRPAYGLVRSVRGHADWVVCGWWVVALFGALACAYSLSYFRRSTVKPFILCLATAGVIGVAFMVYAYVAAGSPYKPAEDILRTAVGSFLAYLPVTFLLEEVWFRGVLDSHLHHPGESQGFLSALYVSLLWGLWHYPVVGHSTSLLATLAQLVVVQVLVGVPLSICWRKSGNLFVTAFTHATIDAVRNALLTL